jgi:hypothetical protein
MRSVVLAFLLATGLVGGCSTTVSESKKVTNLVVAPESVTFIWSSAKPPKIVNMAGVASAVLGTGLQSRFAESYPMEYLTFAETVRPLLQAQAAVHPELVVLPSGHPQSHLEAVLQQVRKRSAVVLMYPETVTGYCAPGCFAFKVRVNYLSAAQRKLVWTGLIELPPRNRHGDSCEPIAQEFTALLMKQLNEQQLLPR